MNKKPPSNRIAPTNITEKPFAQILDTPPTYAEIATAIKSLKNHKAPGTDYLPAELFKNGSEFLTNEIFELWDSIWTEKEIPKDWKTAIILPFFKKGDVKTCSNYRGISLINIAFKIGEIVLKNRIAPAYEKYARENQAGFRPGRGCRDQIFTLRQILEQRYQFKRNTILTFIDFKAAFDSIDRRHLWDICEALGMPVNTLQMLKAMYDESYSCVRAYNQLSEPFAITTGVRQGSILSPLLFIFIVDWIMMTATHDKNFGIQLEETLITDLDFADDIALLEDNINLAQDFLDSVCHTAAAAGLEANIPKTKVLAYHDDEVQITCHNTVLQNVPYFPYLGSNVTVDMDITPEIRSRIAKATGNASRLNKLWEKKDIPTNIKIKIYKACVRSTLLYGCESWALCKSHIASLDSFEVRCARKFLPNSFRKTSEEIRKEAHLGPSIEPVIRERRLKWCGHTLRMSIERFPKNALAFERNSSWKRRSGGQKTSWRKMISSDLEKHLKPYNMRNNIWSEKWPSLIQDVADDRKRWRAVVRDVSEAGNGQ